MMRVLCLLSKWPFTTQLHQPILHHAAIFLKMLRSFSLCGYSAFVWVRLSATAANGNSVFCLVQTSEYQFPYP